MAPAVAASRVTTVSLRQPFALSVRSAAHTHHVPTHVLLHRPRRPDRRGRRWPRGRVVVWVWDVATLAALQDAAMDPVRVTATGPFSGGKGLEDPTSAYYAALAVLMGWSFAGEVPVVPEIPPWDPRVVYAPPAT